MTFRSLTANFYHLILSRSSRNIADSFYWIALSIGLIQVYQIDAGSLSLFALLGLIPQLTSFLYGPVIDQIKQDKTWLITFQVSQLFLIISIICCLTFKWQVAWMYGLNFLFHLVTVCLNTMQMKIIPDTLDNDDDLIDKSIDLQYATSNVLDILSNFLASCLLAVISYKVLLQLSLPFFIAAIYFICRIQLKPKQTIETAADKEPNKKENLAQSIAIFRSSPYASLIVMVESFLSGGTDLLLTLMPLYLLQEGISIQLVGLVLAVQRGADLLGAFIAPKLSISPRRFFFMDYIISGTCLLLVFLVANPYLKLFLFFLTFVIIGISGNIFEKLIYAEYDHDKMAVVYSTNSSLYAFWGILFLLIPSVYQNILVLGIAINALTILVGFYLAINYKKEA
ncbi:MFS transporter [Streptococcus sp. sy004]|uniref:MFS transporter n=1 Tax=Streptococcus sp. sy004 TaxID=2600149 RepID=UPI0011B58E99|nr:MFS transporter [Streptococcus sp. sy004]TWT12175.1 MFS transporter [Streptococcus sp. sy004]